MQNSVKITFWLNKSKKNSDKTSPIYMRVRLNNEFFTKTTGISIVRSDWDSKHCKVKGSSPKSSTYNDYLEGIRLKIIQISTQLNIQGAHYNVRMIKKIMEGDEVKNITLMMVFDDHLVSMQKLV